MLARTGEVKVADFGLARLSGDGAALNLTQVGVTMGTPLYMSPEQVEGRPLDPRSDIYSFGVTCYQMLSGVTPFRGDTALSVALQHLKSQPDRLENLRPDLPAPLSRIVHRMLAKDPQQRYASTRDLLRDLRALRLEQDAGEWPDDAADYPELDTQPLAARSEATQRLDALMKTSSMRAIRRRPLVWALGCLIAFTAGGALAWYTREPFLLSGTHNAGIPRYNTAREQFTRAQFQSTDSEAWYQSVIDNFPGDRYFVPRAKQELAWLYLTSDRRKDALKLFTELGKSDEIESQAFGLAGQALVLTRQGQHAQAAQALALLNLPSLRDRRVDRRVYGMIELAIRTNRRHLSEKVQAELEDLIKQRPSEEDFGPDPDEGPASSRDGASPPGRDRRGANGGR
jgi:serine/threonine-protein kinase